MTFEAQSEIVRRAESKLERWNAALSDKRKFYPVIKAEWNRAFDVREREKTKLCGIDPERFKAMFPNEPNDRHL